MLDIIASDQSIYISRGFVMLFTKDTLLKILKSLKRADIADTEAADIEAQIISALILLPYIEKNIIFSFYIRGDKWVQISGFNRYSVRQCRNICTRAVDALLCRLNRVKPS